MKKCDECETENTQEANFCFVCRNRLKEEWTQEKLVEVVKSLQEQVRALQMEGIRKKMDSVIRNPKKKTRNGISLVNRKDELSKHRDSIKRIILQSKEPMTIHSITKEFYGYDKPDGEIAKKMKEYLETSKFKGIKRYNIGTRTYFINKRIFKDIVIPKKKRHYDPRRYRMSFIQRVISKLMKQNSILSYSDAFKMASVEFDKSLGQKRTIDWKQFDEGEHIRIAVKNSLNINKRVTYKDVEEFVKSQTLWEYQICPFIFINGKQILRELGINGTLKVPEQGVLEIDN